MRRVYGLSLEAVPVLECADLVANLPPGSLVWRRLDVASAWTPTEYLLALQIDQMNMWMWGNADPRKRGPKPRPLPRPGGGRSTAKQADESDGHQHQVRKISVQPMTLDEFQRWRAQRFTDQRVEKSRPLAGNITE